MFRTKLEDYHSYSGDLPIRDQNHLLPLTGRLFTTSIQEAFSFGVTNLKMEDMHYTSSTIIFSKASDKEVKLDIDLEQGGVSKTMD